MKRWSTVIMFNPTIWLVTCIKIKDKHKHKHKHKYICGRHKSFISYRSKAITKSKLLVVINIHLYYYKSKVPKLSYDSGGFPISPGIFFNKENFNRIWTCNFFVRKYFTKWVHVFRKHFIKNIKQILLSAGFFSNKKDNIVLLIQFFFQIAYN